jgi:hypothetical protein
MKGMSGGEALGCLGIFIVIWALLTFGSALLGQS